jgi:hypothetical protein
VVATMIGCDQIANPMGDAASCSTSSNVILLVARTARFAQPAGLSSPAPPDPSLSRTASGWKT